MRELFSGRTTTVLTMVGVAVGLGNVWRFPYMMGQHGGSAFLLAYLLFVAIFAIPAVTAEWSLGRHTRNGPLGAFEQAFGRYGRWIGVLLLLTILIANSYYVVVVANVAFAAGFSVLNGFSSETLAQYNESLSSGTLQSLVGIGVIVAAGWVLRRGVVNGIEQTSKLFVPLFGIIILLLIVMALRLPGALDALRQFMQPDFSQLTPTSIFAALGQAFFSLSLGGTFYVIYGSYLRDNEKIAGAAVITGAGDAGAALLAALFIVPATLAMGLDMQSGPLLIFDTLPNLFAIVPAGRLIGSSFLVALLMMAFLSCIAAFQVIVAALTDSFGMTLRSAVILACAADAILMLPSAFRPELIGTLDMIFGSGMQVLGGGLAIVALFWGCGRVIAENQIFGGEVTGWRSLFLLWLRWVVPAALATILALYVWQSVRG